MLKGTIINQRYELLSKLQSGSQALVFEARDHQEDKRVGIKVYHQSAVPEKTRKRIAREIQVLKRIQHPNIVSYLDSGTFDDNYDYLVLEWLEGENLAELIGKRSFTFAEALLVGRQLASGLERAHDVGVIHRDIKPSNIIFLENKDWNNAVVKLLDFGVAKSNSQTSALTVSGAILGTPCYMAPEQATTAANVDVSADVFSLGVVLYELLVGKLPWNNPEPLVRLSRLLTEVAKPINQFAPNLPPEVTNFLSRSLDIDPQRRPRSMRTVRHCIDQILRRVSKDVLSAVFSTEEVSHETGTYKELTMMVPSTKLAEKSRVLSTPVTEGDTKPESFAPPDPTFEGTLFELGVGDWSESLPLVESESPTDFRHRDTFPEAGIESDQLVISGKTMQKHRSQNPRNKMLRQVSFRINEAIGKAEPGFLLVESAAGMGKSHLLQGLRRSLLSEHIPASVWSVRGEDWAQQRSYWLFRRLFRLLCSIEGSETLSQVEKRISKLWEQESDFEFPALNFSGGRAAGTNTPKDGEVTQVVDQAPLGRTQDGVLTRQACLVAISKFVWADLKPGAQESILSARDYKILPHAFYLFLLSHAQSFGLVLLIDDLHLLDKPSLQILSRVYTNRNAGSIVILGCVQSGSGFELNLDAAEIFHLQALNLGESKILLDETLIAVTKDAREKILYHGSGNPLFLLELIHYYNTTKTQTGPLQLPATVGEAVRARLKELPPLVSDIICAGAVTGDVFWAESIAACLRMNKKRLFTTLKASVDIGLIEPVDKSSLPGCHEFRFSHGVFRSVVLAWHSRSDRRFLHERTARFLRKRIGVDRLALAEHMSKAGKQNRAALLYAECAVEAVNLGLPSFAGRFIDLGWKQLPTVQPSSTAYEALSAVESKLEVLLGES